MKEYLEYLKNQFHGRLDLVEKRPGIFQLLIPLYHEDGDMLEIYLESVGDNGQVRISDHGMTLMRLSYEFDIDTANKERIFQKILSENLLKEQNGTIFLNASKESLCPSVLQFAQTIGKVSNMRLYRREIIKSLFYELLDEFVLEQLLHFGPHERALPILERDDLEVDYELTSQVRKPVYIFGVKDDAKARLVTISCLEFQKASLDFTSIVVHEDIESLSKKDRKRITSAADKQFVDLDDFRTKGEEFIKREAA
jgi:hypothetical protein